MSVFKPSIPITNQIRKIIFERFNDPEVRFTNDEIFEIIRNNGDLDKSWTIDNMEKYFQDICDSGLVRNIAQNFTTVWFKLFDSVEKIHCNSCNQEIYLGKSESRICPNPQCKASI
ncbi:MAG TPA: hypothetical protein VH562_06505 [Nitrosopumilaceae archaeon]|jgi:hypothetical protein